MKSTDSFNVTKDGNVVAKVNLSHRPGLGFTARLDRQGDCSSVALHPYGVGDTRYAAIQSLMDHHGARDLETEIEAARGKLNITH